MKKIILLTLLGVFVLTCSAAIADDAKPGRSFGIGFGAEPTSLLWTAGLKGIFWIIPNTIAFEFIGMPTSGSSWTCYKALLNIRTTQYNRSFLGVGTPLGDTSSSGALNMFIGFENFWNNMPNVATSWEFGLYQIGDKKATMFAYGYNLYF